MAATYETKLQTFKDDFNKEAERLLREYFPKKIVELNDLLHSEMFQVEDLSEFSKERRLAAACSSEDGTPTAAKKKKLEQQAVDGVEDFGVGKTRTVCANQRIGQLIRCLKPEIVTLINSCNKVKVWIQLLIPRIEDGNNFGVSIQEDTLSEVGRVESDASGFLDHVARYFIARGKLASKLLKYPTVEDYQIAMDELDEKQYVALRLTLCEMRNIYSSLHDMIMKNLEKIKTPRSSRLETMY